MAEQWRGIIEGPLRPEMRWEGANATPHTPPFKVSPVAVSVERRLRGRRFGFFAECFTAHFTAGVGPDLRGGVTVAKGKNRSPHLA